MSVALFSAGKYPKDANIKCDMDQFNFSLILMITATNDYIYSITPVC